MQDDPGSRFFISAGDVSGDIHAAGLLRRCRSLAPGTEWFGLGGARMQAAGCELIEPPESDPVMGFLPVIARLPRYLRLLARLHRILSLERPREVVLVDYPGLNLRIAALATRLGIPVTYFICPQLWAWAPWRIRGFARTVNRALVIFPFEEAYFSRHGVPTLYVGHPLCDSVEGRPEETRREGPAAETRGRILALLPGSRRREVEANLPVMLAAARRIRARDPDCRPVMAHQDAGLLAGAREMAAAAEVPLETRRGSIAPLARAARLCLVTSGTATLEAAFTGTPLVVQYRTARIAALLAPLFLTVPWICQVNLIAGEGIVPEHLLARSDPAPLMPDCLDLWDDTPRRREMIARLDTFRRRRMRPGALDRAARALLRPPGAEEGCGA